MAKDGNERSGDDEKHGGKLKRKKYDKELRKLQGELCKLQDWVKHKGLRVSSCSRVATPQARGARYAPSRSG